MNIIAKLKRPASLLLALAFLQISGSLIMFIYVSWPAGIGLIITTIGTIIGWYIKIRQPTVDFSIQYEMSVAFIIRPAKAIILSEKRYEGLVPEICRNIDIISNEICEGSYSIESKINKYHLFIKSNLIENSTAKKRKYKVFSISFTYPYFKFPMNGFDFKNKIPELVDLVKQFCQEISIILQLPNIDAKGIITIWRFLASEGVYDIRFRRKLNSLFSTRFHHEIKLSSQEEKCDFGKDYTEFVFPLVKFPDILTKMAGIVWYSEDC